MEIKRPISKQPIPENAKRVFKGVVYDVYHWEQEMYDGTRTLFEKLKRPDTVVIFPVLPDGKIVIAEEEQPGRGSFVGALGGRADRDEEPLSAAKRELLEESGYTAQEFVLIDARYATNKIDWVIYTFVAKGLDKTAEQDLDGGEKIKLISVTFDEFANLIVDEKKGFGDREMAFKFIEAKHDPEKMEKLKELFKPIENK